MPNLTLVSLEERKRRFFRGKYRWSGFVTNLFLAHLDGLEQFTGKKVLEIGGTDDENTYDFFSSIGADYSLVRLEQNPQDLPYVLRSRDFFHLPEDLSYDLIVSNGVFEKYAHGCSKNMVDYRCQRTNREYLERLWRLTSANGANIIGTISDPCLFSDEEIRVSGFRPTLRQTPFYSLHKEDGYDPNDTTSELVVMVRDG